MSSHDNGNDEERRKVELDFVRLEHANDALSSALRGDEGSPDADLYRRIVSWCGTATSSGTGTPSEAGKEGMYVEAKASSGSSGGSGGSTAAASSSASSGSSGTGRSSSSSGSAVASSSTAGGARPGRGGLFGMPTPWSSPPPTAAPQVSPAPTLSPSNPAMSNTSNTSNNTSNSTTASTEHDSIPTDTIQHLRSLPLPSRLARELSTQVQYTSLMGLLAPAHLVWLTVDHKLYLWSYKTKLKQQHNNNNAPPNNNQHQHYEDYCTFSVPSKQCIVSVGLVRPKPNVFLNSVQWCLILTTPEEILLCALQHSKQGPGFGPDQNLKLIPTTYILPTDGVSMLKVVGTQHHGRVFMAGTDGNLYEMHYEGLQLADSYTNQHQHHHHLSIVTGAGGTSDQTHHHYSDEDYQDLDEDYLDDDDQDQPSLSSRIWSGSKRALTNMLRVNPTSYSSASSNKRRKCTKINHSQTSIFSALLPGFLVKLTSAAVGTTASVTGGAGGLVDVLVDDRLELVYALHANGVLCVYDIASHHTNTSNNTSSSSYFFGVSNTTNTRGSCILVASLDVMKTARAYLESVTRSNSFYRAGGTNYTLAGGPQAAVAGFGGMDGARFWSRLIESSPSTFHSSSSSSSRTSSTAGRGHGRSGAMQSVVFGGGKAGSPLQPTSIHLVSPLESKALHVCLMTRGGLRLYLATKPNSDYRRSSTSGSGSGRGARRWSLTLWHIRAPPLTQTLIKSMSGDGLGNGNGGGGVSESVQSQQRSSYTSSSSSTTNAALSPPVVVTAAYDANVCILGLEGSTLLQDSDSNNSNTLGRSGNVSPSDGALLAMMPLSVRGARYFDHHLNYFHQQHQQQMQQHGFTSPGGTSNVASMTSGGGAGCVQEAFDLPSMAHSSAATYGSSSGVVPIKGWIPGGRMFQLSTSSTPTSNAYKQGSLAMLCLHSKTPTVQEVTSMLRRLPPPLHTPVSAGTAVVMGRRTPRYRMARVWKKGFLVPDATRDLSPSSNVASSSSSSSLVLVPSSSSSSLASNDGSTGATNGAYTLSAVTPASPLSRLLFPRGSKNETQDTIMLLNAGGLHLFSHSNLLDNVRQVLLRDYDALLQRQQHQHHHHSSSRSPGSSSAGEGTLSSQPVLDIERFFASYGNVEACALCLAIAVQEGGPPASRGGTKTATRLYDACKRVVYAHGLRATLMPLASTNTATAITSTVGGMLAPTTTTPTRPMTTGQGGAAGGSAAGAGGALLLPAVGVDAILPRVGCQGCHFQPSALHNGLQLLIARVLRPIWFKPAVMVAPRVSSSASSTRSTSSFRGTRRRTSSSSSSSQQYRKQSRPPSYVVEFLLDPQAEEDMIATLTHLERTMKDIVAHAVLSVPTHPAIDTKRDTAGKSGSTDAMDIENQGDNGGDGRRGLLTSAMRYRHAAAQSSSSTNPAVEDGRGTAMGAVPLPQAASPGAGILSTTTATTVVLSSAKDRSTLARYLEESSLHSLYRLVSRTKQFLSLMNILRRRQEAEEGGVEWGLLHGVTHCQLVCTTMGTERIGSVLNTLVSGGVDGVVSKSLIANQTLQVSAMRSSGFVMGGADRLISSLSNQSYLFFSRGNMLTHQGFAAARTAEGYVVGSVERVSAANQAAVLLRRAARFWTSPKQVTGQVLHTEITPPPTATSTALTTMSSTSVVDQRQQHLLDQLVSFFDTIYKRASPTSPLVRAALALSQIGHVGGVVDVCLACAANFGGSVVGTAAEEDVGYLDDGSTVPRGMLSWEKGLYHGRGVTSGNATSDGHGGMLMNGTSSSSGAGATGTSSSTLSQEPQSPAPFSSASSRRLPSSPSIVDGVDVTSSDARQTCYAVLLHHLNEYLQGGDATSSQVDGMISVCTAATSDLFLQRALYTFLLRTNHVETLLRITSTPDGSSDAGSKVCFLSKWLKEEWGDFELLWRYYVLHGRHKEACDVMQKRATTDTINVPLDERMECLTRAINSATAAASGASSEMSTDRTGSAIVADRSVDSVQLTQLRELLEVAGIQKRILSAVEGLERDPETASWMSLTPPDRERLSTKLIPVSDLYNQYASPLDLWELCLSVLMCCQCNDDATIDVLWRSIICREILPWTTPSAMGSNEEATKLVKLFCEGTPLENVPPSEEDASSNKSFESGDWIEPLKSKVTSLGRELHGKGADYTFPLSLLISVLEGLRRVFASTHPQGDRPGSKALSLGPWPMQCLLDAGVKYSVLLDSYAAMLARTEREGRDPDLRLHYLQCISEVLSDWIIAAGRDHHGAISFGVVNKNPIRVDLSNAISGGLRSSIDGYKASLEALVGGNAERASKILSQFAEIEESLA